MRLALALVLCSGCYLVDNDPTECVPLTCEGQGWDCGPADDGCGGTLECGTCGDLFTCGAGGSPNVCYCPQVTCAEQLATCGSVPDGCGAALECGPCGGASVCGEGGDDNVCALPADAIYCDEASGFCWENPHPVPFEPFDVFARAPDDIWAVGYRGQIRRFDGARWSVVESGTDVLLRGVWAASANDAWATGLDGTLLHWDGATWSPVDLGTAVDLTDVRGTAANNVWVIGATASFRWNGAMWSDATPETPVLYHLWVADATHAWATGGGRVWEWTPGAWVPQTVADDSLTLNGIAGLSASEIYAVGYDDNSEITDPWDKDELVYRFDGSSWTRWDTPEEGPVDGVYATADQVVAVRDDGLSMLSGPPIPSQPPAGRAVGGGVGSDHVVLDGYGGPVRLTGGAWVDDRYGNRDELRPAGRVGGAVWYSSDTRVYAWLGGGLVETAPPPGDVVALSGSSESDVVAIAGGQLVSFDGQSWTPIDGCPADLVALARDGDDVVAAGAAAVGRHTSAGWQSEYDSAGAVWRDVAVDPDGELWVAGSREGETGSVATVAHAGAEGWTELEVPGAVDLCSILVLAPDNVWVGGSTGFNAPAALSHWNGSAWQTEALGYGEACDLMKAEVGLLAVVGGELWHREAGSWARWLTNPLGLFGGLETDDAGGLWIAGSAGAILHRR